MPGQSATARRAAAVDFVRPHPRDRDAVLVMIGALWFALLSGFVPDILHNATTGKGYQPVTHLHAASAVAWMGLLTWQALQVREGRIERHRAAGRRLGPWLAGAVACSAVLTVWLADRAHMAEPGFNFARLAFQVGHVIPFAVLTGIALWRTDRPDLHKRLMLLAVVAIVDAGFSRWVGNDVRVLVGAGMAGQLLGRYPPSWALMGAMALYDKATRGRIHPVLVPAGLFILATQIGAGVLYFAPWWPGAARWLLGG